MLCDSMDTSADAGTSSDVVGEALAGVTDARGAMLLQRLEDFFASPEFSTAIGDFMCEHLETFSEGPGLDLSAAQPLSEAASDALLGRQWEVTSVAPCVV